MPCYQPYLGFQSPSGKVYFKPDKEFKWQTIPIPCGKCLGCRLEYSRQWAIRCTKEASMHTDNCFITLTYDDKFLPKKGVTKSDVQKFFKRLRSEIEYNNLSVSETGLRYFLCGEYGSQTGRAHYHAIIFGFHPHDSVPVGYKNGYTVYESPFFTKVWGLGKVSVGESVTFESCAYVARYIMKQYEKKGDKSYDEFYKIFNKDFILCSRRPAIGYRFFKKNQSELERLDKVLIKPGVLSLPPKYFSRKLKEDNPEKYEEIKQKRIDNAPKETLERCMKRLHAAAVIKRKQIERLKRGL